ncbi:iron ABC transporter permease [Aeromicrobium sp. Leaf245]|uniref:iron ABC transporter permease n=1 Tax=Aeromicrobium sp. Leaf245 TaxID=1736306 RepID=UPI0006F3AF4A|nr:iron ABC transporter permease [Aeromicrobium sp. Leaf245]KQO41849.1 ABC transporter permease [Aeromicrobium sp. Leaf245]
MTLTAERPGVEEHTSPTPVGAPTSRWRVAVVALGLLVAIAVVAAVHVVQGTADVGVPELWGWLTGTGSGQATAVVVESRLPRLAAGVVVGLSLGVAGAVMQSVARNMLASPDTLAVNSGAFLAVTVGATVGVPSVIAGDLVLAFGGGLLAALVVFALAGTEYGTVRLVLAGTVISLGFMAISTMLIILDPQGAIGLQAWQAGTLSQNGFGTLRLMAPLMVVVLAVTLLHARRLDLLTLGDDEARSLGVPVRRTQLTVIVLAVLLSAVSVTVAGPIGFIGLVAPALVRLGTSRVKGLHRHRALVPLSGLAGVAVVLLADVTVRAVMGSQRAVQVPTGVATTILGAVVLVGFAMRLRASRLDEAGNALDVRGLGVRRPGLLIGVLVVLLVVVAGASMLVGDRMFLVGDLLNWLAGRGGPITSSVMDARAPRIVAAVIAGVALAVSGALIQGVTRNPLADPTLLGVSGGASVGAVVVVTAVPAASFWAISGASVAGALLAATLVFGLAARSGFATDRLVLLGVGVAYGATATVTVLIVATDPFNAAKALTWLSGSTYGRAYEHLTPLVVACVLLLPIAFAASRRLDLLSVDEDTPRVVGVDPARSRLLLLGSGTLLTAAAVSVIGVVGFVGLVAPHAARALVGRRHRLVIPVAALLGAIVLSLSDLLGRTVVAPTQLSASLLTAAIGTPYFLYLLHRSRRT